MKNNIFKFATKELSQDAFLAWLLNWINEGKNNEDIKEFAKEFVSRIIKGKKDEYELNEWIKLIESNDYKMDIRVQFYNIDILAIIYDVKNNKYLAIIIEDKVNTLEHDSQIERYKDFLISNLSKEEKYKDITEDNIKILTCYYKPYDECRVKDKENKKGNRVFTRDDMLNLMKKYENIEYQYYKEYKEYLEAIQECATKYSEENIANEIIEKKKYDIKYLAFFKKIEEDKDIYDSDAFPAVEEKEEKYFAIETSKDKSDKPNFSITNYKKESIYYDIGTTRSEPTWWCNIPIKFCIESDNIFNKYVFIKINFYKERNPTIMLKASKYREAVNMEELCRKIDRAKSKKTDWEDKAIGFDFIKVYNRGGKYYKIFNKFDGRIFKNQKVAEKVISVLEKTKKCCEKYEVNLKLSRKGSTTVQPEMNIFTIDILEKDFEKRMIIIEELIKAIKSDLENKKIEVWVENDTSTDLKAEEVK